MTTPTVNKIAGILKQALPAAGLTEAATLTRLTAGTRTTGNLAAGTNPTSTTYPCKGFVSDESHKKIGGTLVDQTHLVVCVLGLGTTIPTTNDKVTIDGATYPVVDLQGSVALWTLLCRR